MKRSLILAAFASTLALTPAIAGAAETIAVVNVQEIMAKSQAAKSIRSQLESTSKAYKGDITKQEERLKTEQADLKKQQSVLSQDAFQQKVKSFQEDLTKVQRDAATKKGQLDSASAGAAMEVQKAVQGIIQDMAQEKGFTLAIPSSQVLYAKPDMDITQDVLSRLDQKLPRVTVKTGGSSKTAD